MNDQPSAPSATQDDPVSALLNAAQAASGNPPAAGAPSPASPASLQGVAEAAQSEKDQAALWKAPDFVPENFRGKTAEETLNNLVKSVQGYRERDAKAEKIPEVAEAYQYQPSETIKPYLAETLADDPVFQAARAAAHEFQIPPSKFQGFLDKVLGSMVEAGAVERPMHPDQIMEAFVPDQFKTASRDERMREAGKHILSIDAAFQAYAADQKLPDAVKREAMILYSSPAGLQLLQALLPKGGATPENNIRLGGQSPSASGQSREDLKARQADPRNDPGSSKFDERFSNETKALYQKFYGNG